MALTRRNLIKAALAAPLLPLTGTHPVEAVEPTAVISAIGLFTQILQSQRGDGGTEAILSAINGKVDIIISQLAAVQLALAQMTSQIAQVKDEVLKAIGQQYSIELFNQSKAGLLAIMDIQREAESKSISLEIGNERHGLEKRLEDAWKEFDQSRRRLREYDQGRGLISVPLLDAMVLADHAAFAAGVINEAQFAIILERHLNWLDRIVSPGLEFSVRAFASKARADEFAERKAIKVSAQSRTDAVAIIAEGLLKELSTRICAITTMDVEYWSEFSFKEWKWLRGNEYLIAPIYTVRIVDQDGAMIFANASYSQEYEAEVSLGGRHTVWKTPGISTVDRNKCMKFGNGDLHLLSEDSFKGKFADQPETSDEFYRGIGSYVSGSFISNSVFARAISTNGKVTADAVQLLLDRVNLQILNQRLAQLAIETVAGNRSFAESLAAALPTIPRMQQ